MNPKPLVSVNMIVYNGSRFIEKSIQSVLLQTYKNFELIIVDDGSADNTVEIIQIFDDHRIKLFKNETNRGIVYSRNKALGLSKGEYIAINDSDDISKPERLEKQVAFLLENPEFGFCGTNIQCINSTDEIISEVWELSLSSELLPTEMFFRNMFVHSSILFNKTILNTERYLFDYTQAEDYELFIRLLNNNPAQNINENLVQYRIHNTNITKTQSHIQINSIKNILHDYLVKLKIEATPLNIESHFNFLYQTTQFKWSFEEVKATEKWVKLLIKQNDKIKIFDRAYFKKRLIDYWQQIYNVHEAHKLGFKAIVLVFSNLNSGYSIVTSFRLILRILKYNMFST